MRESDEPDRGEDEQHAYGAQDKEHRANRGKDQDKAKQNDSQMS